MQETLNLPELRPSLNDQRIRSLIAAIAKAPNLYLRATALEACLRQVWALVPEEDEELFFDNIQAVCRQARKWKSQA